MADRVPDPSHRILEPSAGYEDSIVLSFPQGMALVQTVDIIAPIHDEPRKFGQIAAANALSDIYAMGGDVWCAMNIAFFPSCLKPRLDKYPPLTESVLAEILSGGADKIKEAGGVLAGGHTVEDDELKYGLAVSGFIDPSKVARKNGLTIGDKLVLTKPLGTGILATAIKARFAGHDQAADTLYHSASALNKFGARAIREFSIKGATDVTGFGLIGHLLEMLLSSNLSAQLNLEALPLLQGVEEYASIGLIPGGTYANKKHIEKYVHKDANADSLLEMIAYDAQSSGGLLLSVAPEKLNALKEFYSAHFEDLWIIGEVVPNSGTTRLRLK